MKPFRTLTALPIILFGICLQAGCTGGSPRISGLGDPLEDKVRLSTQDYSSQWVIGSENADPFFRGYVNKETDDVTHQIYFSVNSGMDDWEHWSSIVFLVDGDRKEMDLESVAQNAKATEYGLIYYEDVVADLAIEDIEYMAAQESTTVRLVSGRSSKRIDVDVKGEEAQLYIDLLKQVRENLEESSGQ